MFRPGHALPLVCTRILCPRISRGEYLNKLGDIDRSWPRTRHIRELEQSPMRMHKNIMRVREQSASANATHRLNNPGTALAADTNTPHAVRSLELSGSANWPETGILSEPPPARKCPRRRILVSMQSATRLPIRIRIIPSWFHS